MAKNRGLNEERWDLLVERFRGGDTLTQAAKVLDIDRKTAKKALEDGYPPGRAFPAGKPPIQQLLDADKARASAATQVAKYEKDAEDGQMLADKLLVAVTKATEGVVESHAESGLRLHLASKSTSAALASAARLQIAGDALAKRLTEKIEAMAKWPAADLDLKFCVQMLREIARFTRDSAESMKIIDELERRHLGDANDVKSLLLELTKTENIDDEEAEHIIEVGMQVLGVDAPSEAVDLEEAIDAEYTDLVQQVEEEDERSETEGEEEEEGMEEDLDDGAAEGEASPSSDNPTE
jgi:hypothetical protein